MKSSISTSLKVLRAVQKVAIEQRGRCSGASAYPSHHHDGY